MFFSQAAIALFAVGLTAAAPVVEKRAAITDGKLLFLPPSQHKGQRGKKNYVSSVILG
jgi:hypothetical protein